MANKFDGELKWIDPNFLVDKNHYNKTESFFIGLGVVYNDLRGLLLFQDMFVEKYEQPKPDEVTVHAGNYGGIIVQIEKLIAGTISEFFIFLQKNADVFEDSEFKQILSQLSQPDRQLWNSIRAAANGELSRVKPLLKTIAMIRNNIAYHYDKPGKVLRKGYISHFFESNKNNKNELAFYSIGDNIETTRFYFSDAAVEKVLFNSVENKLFVEYRKQIEETIIAMSRVISKLLKRYIQSRRDQPH